MGYGYLSFKSNCDIITFILNTFNNSRFKGEKIQVIDFYNPGPECFNLRISINTGETFYLAKQFVLDALEKIEMERYNEN